MKFDMARVTALIREVAAEEIVPRLARLGRYDVVEMTPGDFVTVADLASVKRFGVPLPKMLVGSRVIGGEAGANHPGLLSMLDRWDEHTSELQLLMRTPNA